MEKQSSKLDIPRPNGVPPPPQKLNQRLRSFLLFSSLSLLTICSLIKCGTHPRFSYGLDINSPIPLTVSRFPSLDALIAVWNEQKKREQRG